MDNKQQTLTLINKLLTMLNANNIIDANSVSELNNYAEQLFSQVKQPMPSRWDIDYYMNKLENLISPDKVTAKNIIENIYAFNPGVIISILAKMIAIDLDQNYEDHILNSTELYCISLIDGRIQKVYTPQIKNHSCIALFRTLDDAKVACHILAPILKSLYGKQKDKKH